MADQAQLPWEGLFEEQMRDEYADGGPAGGPHAPTAHDGAPGLFDHIAAQAAGVAPDAPCAPPWASAAAWIPLGMAEGTQVNASFSSDVVPPPAPAKVTMRAEVVPVLARRRRRRQRGRRRRRRRC